MAEQTTPSPDPKKPQLRPRKIGRGLKLVITGILIAIVVSAVLSATGQWLFFQRPSVEADTTVIIPKGTGLLELSTRLEEADVVPHARGFALGVRLLGAGRELQAGEYAFDRGMTMYEVMEKLRQGETVVRRLTIPEGLSTAEILAQIRAEQALSGEIADEPEEGILLPETYHFHWGDDRQALVERMKASMREAINNLWAERQDGLPLKTPYEAKILASIVEKETGVASERPHVAGVFINRLNRGMPLQSDPTVVYGITGGGPLGRPLRRSELDSETPYNTYQFRGLPPTPIANPGLASLKAVLNPLETEDLYFVADGTGGHAFAETYREHQRNVRKWRQLERERESRGE